MNADVDTENNGSSSEPAGRDARRPDLAALRNGPARQFRMRHELAGEPVFMPVLETYEQYLGRLAAWSEMRN